jgi:hypothetical protein
LREQTLKGLFSEGQTSQELISKGLLFNGQFSEKPIYNKLKDLITASIRKP